MSVVGASSVIIVAVGVFELAREIHDLHPEDRSIVLHLVRDLKQAAAAVSGAHSRASEAAVPVSSWKTG